MKTKRIIGILLTLTMIIGLLPITASATDEISYIDRTWDETNNKVVETIKSITDYTVVESTTTAMADGWYVVKEDVTVTDRIAVTGTVNLILADGAHLTANNGVSVNRYNTLNIYGQSEDSGKLTATATAALQAGIGADGGYANGTDLSRSGLIVIKGGTVEAHSFHTSRGGAGIGGGDYTRNGSIDGIEIYGGTVNASSQASSDAIGYGFAYLGRSGEVKIYGGNVTAKADANDNFTVHIRNATIKGGIVTQGNETVIYSSITLDEDMTVAADMSFVVPNGISLSIAAGTTFTVEGALTVNGVIYNEGSLVNNGAITNNGEIYSGEEITGTGTMSGDGIYNLTLHKHSWTDFKADGNVITATCTNEDGKCEIKNASATLIAPENAVYNGTAYTVTLENTFPSDIAVNVVYSGDNLKNGKSVNAGEYTASVTISGTTATVDYEIAKAQPLAEHFVNDSIRYYNGEKKTPSVKVKDGILGMGEIINVEVIGDAVEEGTYPIVFGVSEGENYLAAQFTESDNFTLVIYICEEHQFVDGKCDLCEYVCPHTNMSKWAKFLDDSGNYNDSKHKRQCPDCGLEEYEYHRFIAMGQHGSNYHHFECICNYEAFGTTSAICSGGKASCNTLAVCDACKTGYGETDPNNHEGYVNGICACGKYEEPELKDNYYQIKNTGNLYWFANHINTVDRTANAVLLADIDLEGKPDGTGRKWTPIGSTGENSNNFRGHFDGNNHTITNLYIDEQRAGLGFFGEVRLGIVENFTIYGDVKLTSDCSYVGGVIGSAPGANGTDVPDHNGATIRNITSYVNVTLVENAHGSSFVGGFIGYANHETIIENCLWYGTLDLGAYRADSGVGGLVGRLYDKSNVTIRNCAAYGTIKTSYKSGTHNNYDTIYIGGVLSFSPAGTQAVLENNLWAGNFIDDTNLGDKAHLSAFGTLNGEEVVTNCYTIDSEPYLTTENVNANGITIITAQQLANGEVAYLLQGEQTTEVWGQDLTKENTLPMLYGTKVYKYTDGYSNELKFGFADYTTDGAVFNIPTAGTYTLVFADYEGGRLNDIDIVPITVTADKVGRITQASKKSVTLGTGDKITLWQDITNLVPLCETYIVK